MFKFFKIAAASLVLVGFATTAQAGTVAAPNAQTNAPTSSQAMIQKTSNKKIVRKVKALPQARKVATHSTRTVLFYNSSSSRSKVIVGKVVNTSTPNLFN